MRTSKHLRSIIISLSLVTALSASAKVSYLSNYYTHVTLEEDSVVTVDSTILDEMYLSTMDQRFDIAILHDSLNDKHIQKIKQVRALRAITVLAAISSAVASLGSVTQVALSPLSYSAQFYASNAFMWAGATVSFTFLNHMLKNKLDDLEKLPINITITNNTDREMCVNDLSRGLFWYVRANSALTMSVGNPEINQFRVAYADTTDPRPCYLIVQAYNEIERHPNLIFEDDSCWIYTRKKEKPNGDYIWFYYTKDKQTMVETLITEKMATEYKRTHREPFVY